MKKLFLGLASVATLATACQSDGIGTNPSHDLKQDSISYALGSLVGKGVEMQFLSQLPFDTINTKALAAVFANSKLSENYINGVKMQLDTIYTDVFMTAFSKQLSGEKMLFTPEEAEKLLNDKVAAKRAEEKKVNDALAAKNLAEGQAFLADNAAKEGVTTTESGLQYKVITKGNGAVPKSTDRVKCNYRGTLLNGDVFDETKDGEPATFAVGGLIKGWQEALQMMPVGSKWELYIPAELAYGERGGGAKIGPNATLIFTLELLEIVK